MSSDLAIAARNLGKCYRIYDRPEDRLRESLARGIRRVISPLQRLQTRKTGDRETYYREFWALQDVTLEVPRGETFGIVGLNGSGKSTLLQIIAGTLQQTTGEVSVTGRVAALLELGSGFNPEFTGRENVYLNGAILGLTREQIGSRFAAIAAFADIGDFIEQPVKTYSSGMAVRLAFAVMAHVDADVLIIDEALSVGDVLFSQKCMRFLRAFQTRGTVILVSHDTGAIINLCRRAMWLQHGRAQRIGDAKSVTEAYVEAYYERIQGASATRTLVAQKPSTLSSRKDQRLKFINQSAARNDIQLFSFDPDGPSFGKGGAEISDALFLTEKGEPLSWIVGGEDVALLVRAVALTEITGPVIGFFVKDHLGQALFGDNTFLTFSNRTRIVRAGQVIEARFAFAMPLLPVGDYTISVALAEGTQENHVQHHWIHDAIRFRSHSSSTCTGLVGIPMGSIEMDVLDSDQKVDLAKDPAFPAATGNAAGNDPL